MSYTRREFGKRTLVALPAMGALLPVVGPGLAEAAQAPGQMSKWAGVQVGLNVPYSLGTGNNISAEDLLVRLVDLRVGALELRAQPVEHFLGSPTIRAAADAAARGRQQGGGGRGGGRGSQTPEQIAAARRQTEEVRQWRLGAPMTRVKEFRQMYENAGVLIEILKIDGLYGLSNEELDYFFQMARDLGARAISAELPTDLADAARIGQFADKYRIFAAYHHHQQPPATYDTVFSQARYNAANIDIGHFTAVQNTSPLPFITKHADRIPHIHVKDRRLGTNGGDNVPFGQGDTQIREILTAIRDNKWNIQATVEFEYPVPEGSTREAEIRKSFDYCRSVLMG